MRKVIASIALTMAVAGASAQKNSSVVSADVNKDAVLSVIHSRKSVRNFVPNKAVSREDLTTLVKAGMAAPSAVNKQPWHFVVVDDRATLDKLAEKLPYAKMLKTAPAAIIVCGDESVQVGGRSYWVCDCSAASENILLAAEAMGLGGVWTAAYPYEDRIVPVREAVGLPSNIVPLNVIPIGYPTGQDLAKDKYKPEKIHFNKW